MNTQDTQVVNYLQSIGVEYSARLLGETNHGAWPADEWRISFWRNGKPSIETQFFTGTGHRKPGKHGGKATAQSPSSAGVLYSLIMEAQGAEQPFDQWCDEYGYDQDSRKALSTYDACCAIRRQISAFFTTEERTTVADMLEDY